MKTTYIVDLGILGEVEFYVEYTCYEGTPDTREQPGDPAYIEIDKVYHEVYGSELCGLVEDYLNGDGYHEFGELHWDEGTEEDARDDLREQRIQENYHDSINNQ